MTIKPIAASLILAAVSLSGARGATADILTVGPGGDFAAIQPAIDAALARGGANEIHIAHGRWPGRLVVGDLPGDGGFLALIGGYADDFASASSDASATVLDGNGEGPVVQVSIARGKLVMTALTVAKGGRPVPGGPIDGTGGVRLFAGGRSEVVVANVTLRDNNPLPVTSQVGAGLWAQVSNDARLVVRDSRFVDNSALLAGVPGALPVVSGGAAWITALHRARVEVVSNTFQGNVLTADGVAQGAALSLGILDSATAEVTGNLVSENRAAADWAACVLDLGLAGERAPLRLVARRTSVVGNRGGQVCLNDWTDGMLFSDSLVSGGDSFGILASPSDGTRLFLTNLTVADNAGNGVDARSSKVVLANSIVSGNHAEVAGPLDSFDANLIGVEPLFVDRPHGNYRVQPRSPAVDAGDDAPESGLGPLDLDRHDRIRGASVDIGAYEASPGCRVLWPFSDPSTPACTCVSDPGLRSARCGFMLPDVFLVADVPLDVWPPPTVDWTIHPWTKVSGAYALSTLAEVGEKWRTQAWLGPSEPALKEGQLVHERFALDVDAGEPLPLRTVLTYQRSGEPRRVEVEVLLRRPDGAGK